MASGDHKQVECALSGKQLLVKRSYVNGCLAELRTQIVDELQNCVFLRVVSAGPDLNETKHKGSVVGSLVALHEGALGSPLELLGIKPLHYIVKYSDVVGVLDF